MASYQIQLAINACRVKIESNNKKIRKKEKAYESLQRFKNSVVSYQATFASSNDSKDRVLDAVWSIKKDCVTADRYYKGMKGLVPVIGAKIVGSLLEKLLVSAQIKLKKYVDDINDLEDENTTLREKIERLQKDLKLAEMEEAIADANN